LERDECLGMFRGRVQELDLSHLTCVTTRRFRAVSKKPPGSGRSNQAGPENGPHLRR
jgi:hypothetical protein